MNVSHETRKTHSEERVFLDAIGSYENINGTFKEYMYVYYLIPYQLAVVKTVFDISPL